MSGVVSSVSVAPQHTATPQRIRVSVVERAPPVPDVWSVLPGGSLAGSANVITVVSDRQGTLWMTPRNPASFVRVPNRGQGTPVQQATAWGMSSPHGLAVDTHDNIWASETAFLSVKRWTNFATGTLSALGLNGATSGAMRGIFVDELGYVFACDATNDRLIRWAAWGGVAGTDSQYACTHARNRSRPHLVSVECVLMRCSYLFVRPGYVDHDVSQSDPVQRGCELH